MSAEATAATATPPARSRHDRMARAVWGLAALIAIIVGGRALTFDYDLERDLWLSRASGWSALGALLLSLSMTPLGRLAAGIGRLTIDRAIWPALRRNLGIAAATLGLLHAAINVLGYLDFAWGAIVTLPYLRAGLVTLAILVPLLVTSFPRVTRGLRVRLWKPLHRLAYVAALFAFQHVFLAPFAPRRLTLFLFGLVAVLGFVRLLPKR